MFDGLRRFVGAVQVKQTETSIIVSGIPADVMAKDISRIWGTSKLTANMFSMISKNALIFPLFFAPDVVYAIDVIMQDRSKRVSMRTLDQIKEKLLSETWLASTLEQSGKGRLNYSKLKDMVLTPLDFQQNFIDVYNKALDQYQLKGYLFAGAPGSGKTNSALTISAMLEADLVIVVAPRNSIEKVWEPSVNTLFKEPPHYWLAHKGLMTYGNEKFLIGHYEAIHLIKDAMLTRMRQLGHAAKVMVILDESHNINEIVSNRTLKFIELAELSKSKDILWLSGTPIKALGSESIPLFRCIDPYFTPEVELAFKKIYGKDGKKGLDILQHRLGMVSFKVEKSELGLIEPSIQNYLVKTPTSQQYSLSAITDDMRNYVLERRKFYASTAKKDTEKFFAYLERFERTLINAEDKKFYTVYRSSLDNVVAAHNKGDLRSVKEQSIYCNKYEKEVIRESLANIDKEEFKHLKTLVKYVSLKIQGEALGRVLGRKRIECHLSMVPYVDYLEICDSTLKKTIIFTSFVEVLTAGADHTRGLGMYPAVVYGETNKDLTTITTAFEKDKKVNPLWATFNSLSTAVPLVMADTIIMMNAPFRDYIDQQAIARTARLGANTQTRVYRVLLDTGTEPNLSTRSADILKWSQEQVEKIMGIASPFEIKVSEALENFSEDPLFTIDSEEFDITETISLEYLKDLFINTQKPNPAFASW